MKWIDLTATGKLTQRRLRQKTKPRVTQMLSEQ